MSNANKVIFQLLVRSFIITAFCLLAAIISVDDSLAEIVFGGIGFFGIFGTVVLFKVHVILWIISLIFKKE